MNFEKYENIPYKDHGRDFNGIDCYGLIYLVYKEELGIVLPSLYAEYENAEKVPFSYVETHKRFEEWKKVEKSTMWDVGLFKLNQNFHVGLCVDRKGTKILHITKGETPRIEDVRSMLWRRRFLGWWRYDS